MHLAEPPFKAMGPQPPFDTRSLETFVSAPRVGILSYNKRDGTPAQAPIWYRYRDGRFQMLTSATSPKAKALAREQKACLTIQDELPPYRAVIVDGAIDVRAVDPDDERSLLRDRMRQSRRGYRGQTSVRSDDGSRRLRGDL